MAVPAISPDHKAALDHAAARRWALALATAQQARAKESNPEHRKEIDQLIENSTHELRVRVANAQQPRKAKIFRVLTAFWFSGTAVLVMLGVVWLAWTLHASDQSRTVESAAPISPAPTRVVEIDALTTASTASPSFQPFWVRNYGLTEMWSGPVGQPGVVSFGTTSEQFCVFLVIERQDNPRLHVLNPYMNNYLWIDSSAVGPITAPEHRLVEREPNENCSDADVR